NIFGTHDDRISGLLTGKSFRPLLKTDRVVKILDKIAQNLVSGPVNRVTQNQIQRNEFAGFSRFDILPPFCLIQLISVKTQNNFF
ncbi:MAG TPA: hypothetical protein PLK58_17870, partial [Candidatus Rifleibacterium sp.]|nr:hypothetical protein [Candidatus Rifleibacterium sp.]